VSDHAAAVLLDRKQLAGGREGQAAVEQLVAVAEVHLQLGCAAGGGPGEHVGGVGSVDAARHQVSGR
jgi:hypothetical protein